MNGMRATLATLASRGIARTGGTLGPTQLGIEVGSLSTFFSSDHPERGNVYVEHHAIQELPDARVIDYAVRYPDARLHIRETEQAFGRSLTVEALDDSLLMDAVLRFVFPLPAVAQVALAERMLPWRRQNRYHQQAGASAEVALHDRVLLFKPSAESLPTGLSLLTYLRDEPEAWILHVRVRANAPTVVQTRGCSRWYNRPLPLWAQRMARAIPGFDQSTLYIRERISQRIPFQTNGAVRLRAGERFEFTVKWDITERASHV